MSSKFVYVTYIKTTPEKLWQALTTPEFQRQYWYGYQQETDYKKGSSWKLISSDGRVADSGEVVESDPPRRLVLTWRHQLRPELTAEGDAKCTYEIEEVASTVKLTVTHEIAKEQSKLIEAVSGGWPRILSSLKSFLETGASLPEGSTLRKAS